MSDVKYNLKETEGKVLQQIYELQLRINLLHYITYDFYKYLLYKGELNIINLSNPSEKSIISSLEIFDKS